MTAQPARPAPPTTSPATSSTRSPADTPRLGFGGLVASESLKARGLRSTWWLLSLALLVPVLVALVTALTGRSDVTDADTALAEAVGAVTDTNYLGLLLLVVLGTIVGTAEYERGAVLTTFAVVPRRVPVVLAKVVVVAVVALVVSVASGVVSFFVAALVLGHGAPGGIADPVVLRVLAGTAFFQAAAAVIGLAFGLLVRSSAGGIAATLGFLYVVPALLQVIPVDAVGRFARSLPGPEGTVLELPSDADGATLAWSALAIAVWTAVVVAAACVVVRRRDV
ncbi:ABC transporter permease [Cellulosimicrobium sp. Marseille-Q8652]